MKKVEESNYDSLGVIPNDDIMASGWRLSNEGKKRGVELLQENEELRGKLKSYPVRNYFNRPATSPDSGTSARILVKYVTVQLLPLIAKECNTSVSWIVTGHDIGEEGCIRIPSEEGLRFYAALDGIAWYKRNLLAQLLQIYCPQLPVVPEAFRVTMDESKAAWNALLMRLAAVYSFPAHMPIASSKYYEIPEDMFWLKLREYPDLPLRAKGSYHFSKFRTLAVKNKSFDASVLLAFLDAAELPLRVVTQWDDDVPIYSDNPQNDFLVDLFLSSTKEGKELAWAFLGNGGNEK